MANVGNWFFRLAVLYLMAGVALGLFMAASHDHSMFPAHAHLNLLGWVTMALFAGFYRLWPAAATSPLAKVHFWLYVPTHFVQMAALFILMRGVEAVEPVLAISSFGVAGGIVVFAINVWKHTAVRATSVVQAMGTVAG